MGKSKKKKKVAEKPAEKPVTKTGKAALPGTAVKKSSAAGRVPALAKGAASAGVKSSVQAAAAKEFNFVHAAAYYGLAALLFLPPYFRGLFFAPEQERALIAAAFIFGLAWLWKWSRRDHDFVSHPLDYFVLAFPAVYAVAALGAANYGLAVDEVVKTLLYFLVYWLAARLVLSDADVDSLLRVIYLSAVGVSLAGLATATGVIHIKDGFLGGRIYSTFQYPNALASYLAAVLFMGFYFWFSSFLPEGVLGGGQSHKTAKTGGKTAFERALSQFVSGSLAGYLYAAGNALILMVFFGTKSQGGFLVFVVAAVLFLAGAGRDARLWVFLHAVLTAAVALFCVLRFLAAVEAGNPDLAWLWVFAGLLAALALQAVFSFGFKKGMADWVLTRRKVLLAAAAAALVLMLVLAGYYIAGHGEALKELAEEIRLRNAAERMYFFKDAMKMFLARPILGWGGGGWQEAYRGFQSYLYHSNQVHGHYFQVMVETGIAGIAVMAGMWVCFLAVAHRLYHGTVSAAARRRVLAVTVASAVLGLHAVIDFDLSLSAIALVLWTMFGLARGMQAYTGGAGVKKERKPKRYVPPNNAVLVCAWAAAAAVITLTGCLVYAGSCAREASACVQKQDLNGAVGQLKAASTYNPLNPDYRMNLARLLANQGRYEEALAEAKRALDLGKYSAPRYALLAEIYYDGLKDRERAVEAAEKALSLAPFQIEWYEFLARIAFLAGYSELAAGEREKAGTYLALSAGVPGRIEEKMASIGPVEKRLWVVAPLLEPTPAVRLNAGASQYLLGYTAEAEGNLKAALTGENTGGEAALWLAVLYAKGGRSAESEEMLARAKEAVPSLAQGFANLLALEQL